jgi:hypothetical protein
MERSSGFVVGPAADEPGNAGDVARAPGQLEGVRRHLQPLRAETEFDRFNE